MAEVYYLTEEQISQRYDELEKADFETFKHAVIEDLGAMALELVKHVNDRFDVVDKNFRLIVGEIDGLEAG